MDEMQPKCDQKKTNLYSHKAAETWLKRFQSADWRLTYLPRHTHSHIEALIKNSIIKQIIHKFE